ncbi:MAG: pilus assembly protein [Bacilli bacterium]|nr:pilus assembly protein [Bacilli bacterium]
MKLNIKGQALIEFVLLIPVLIMIIFAMIDFGNIFYTKNELENKTTDIIEIHNKNNFSYQKIINSINNEKNNYRLELKDGNDTFYKIVLKKDIKIINPVLKLILSNPYEIKVERIMTYE